jgi:hypothetical protein
MQQEFQKRNEEGKRQVDDDLRAIRKLDVSGSAGLVAGRSTEMSGDRPLHDVTSVVSRWPRFDFTGGRRAPLDLGQAKLKNSTCYGMIDYARKSRHVKG